MIPADGVSRGGGGAVRARWPPIGPPSAARWLLWPIVRRVLIVALATLVTAVTAVTVVVLAGRPALAATGDQSSPDSFSGVVTALVFVGIPLIVGLVVAGLVAAGQHAVGAVHWRPGRVWAPEPVWFGDQPAAEAVPATPAAGIGGTSARW
jgi:hypothetical protein